MNSDFRIVSCTHCLTISLSNDTRVLHEHFHQRRNFMPGTAQLTQQGFHLSWNQPTKSESRLHTTLVDEIRSIYKDLNLVRNLTHLPVQKQPTKPAFSRSVALCSRTTTGQCSMIFRLILEQVQNCVILAKLHHLSLEDPADQ